MFEKGVITINNFQVGQAESPYLGFDTMRNVEVFNTPGIVRPTYKTILQDIPMIGMMVSQVRDDYGNSYQLVSDTGSGDALLYKNGVSYSSLTGTGWDMIFYKGYILVRHGTSISALETTVASPTLFQAWKTGFQNTYYGKMLVSRSDGYVYITDGSNVKRISAFVAGATGVAPTATLDTAIVLPDGYKAVTFVELGSRLMVGTQSSNSIWSTRYASTVAAIFPYRIGVSATRFDDPIVITNANAVHQMIVSNGVMYIHAGLKGNIYLSDGTSYRLARQLPFFKTYEYGIGIMGYPNAIAINNDGNLYIGTQQFQSGYYGNAVENGVYEINLATGKYECVLKNTISTGNSTGTQTIAIGSLFPYNDGMYIGWQDGSTYGLDYTSVYPYNDFSAYIESKMFIVGGALTPKKFENVEILLTQPLTADQVVRISYRTEINGTYTVATTFSYDVYGAKQVMRADCNIPASATLQIKIDFDVNSTGLITQNVELMACNIW